MIKFKTVFFLLMAIFIFASITACNQTEDATKENEVSSSKEENETINEQTKEQAESLKSESESEESKEEDKIVLPDIKLDNPDVSFLYTNGPDEMYEKMVQKFKEYTGQEINIIYDVVTWNEYQTKLAVMVMAGQAPDMYQIDRVVTPYIIRNDLFEPMDELIDYDAPLWAGLKPYTDYSTYKGKIYSIPSDKPRCIQCIIYNRKFFEEFGLEEPRELYKNGEWTWDRLVEYAEMFTQDTDGDGKTDVYGLSMGDYACMYFAVSTGKDIITFNPDGTIENNLRNPDFERAFKVYYDLGKAGTLDPVQWEHQKNFPQNKIAMRLDHFWITVNEPYNSMIKNDEISFVPLPKDPKADKYYHVALVADKFVPKGASNAQGAIAWYTFSRYLQLVPDEQLEQEEYELMTKKWGWSEEDIQIAEVDMREKLYPIFVVGDRIPGFAKQSVLWNLPTKEPWSKVVETVNPNFQEAIDKLIEESK